MSIQKLTFWTTTLQKTLDDLPDAQRQVVFSRIKARFNKPDGISAAELDNLNRLQKSLTSKWSPDGKKIKVEKVVKDTGEPRGKTAEKAKAAEGFCSKNPIMCVGGAGLLLSQMIIKGTADPFKALGGGASTLVSNIMPPLKDVAGGFGEVFSSFFSKFWWVGLIAIGGIILLIVVLKMMK